MLLRLCLSWPSPPSSNVAMASSSARAGPARASPPLDSGLIWTKSQRSSLRSDGYGGLLPLPSTGCHSQSFMEAQGNKLAFTIKATPCNDSSMPSSPGISEGLEYSSILTSLSKDCQGSTILGELISHQLPSAFDGKFSNDMQLETCHSLLWDQASEQSVKVPVQSIPVPFATRCFDMTKQLGLTALLGRIHKLAKAAGCLSLGSSESQSVSKIDTNSTELLLPTSPFPDVQWHDAARASGNACSSITMMAIRVSPEVIDSHMKTSNIRHEKITSTMKSSTTKRHQSKYAQKKSTVRPSRSGKIGLPRRDLFRSPIQLYGIVLCFPFMDAKSAATSLQTLSVESLEELVAIFSQIAIGLAGSGFVLVLFVTLRLLTINAALDGTKITAFARGMGLMWLSLSVKSLGSSVKCLTRSSYKFDRKELMAKLKSDFQSLTFKAFALITLLVVRVA